MTNMYRIDSDEEALFPSHSNPYAIYYVQSPSAFSHANSTGTPIQNYSIHPSPIPFETHTKTLSKNTNLEATSLALSRYSSTNSFLPEKEEVGRDRGWFTVQEYKRYERIIAARVGKNCREDVDEDEDGFEESGGRWQRWLTFSHSSSYGWKALQVGWRFLVSMVVALVVFSVLTKPPAPKISIKVAGMPEFELSEGVDGSGVSTKVLTCNCSLNLMIDNKSKIFGLRVHSPRMELSFGHLTFALAQGPDFRAEAYGWTNLKFFVGTKKKPMYAAGRRMQELMESKNGVPLLVHVSIHSSFHVVWGLIKPKYHHKVECLILITVGYNNKSKSQNFISTCKVAL